MLQLSTQLNWIGGRRAETFLLNNSVFRDALTAHVLLSCSDPYLATAKPMISPRLKLFSNIQTKFGPFRVARVVIQQAEPQGCSWINQSVWPQWLLRRPDTIRGAPTPKPAPLLPWHPRASGIPSWDTHCSVAFSTTSC